MSRSMSIVYDSRIVRAPDLEVETDLAGTEPGSVTDLGCEQSVCGIAVLVDTDTAVEDRNAGVDLWRVEAERDLLRLNSTWRNLFQIEPRYRTLMPK
jgi:hypothetical protein